MVLRPRARFARAWSSAITAMIVFHIIKVFKLNFVWEMLQKLKNNKWKYLPGHTCRNFPQQRLKRTWGEDNKELRKSGSKWSCFYYIISILIVLTGGRGRGLSLNETPYWKNLQDHRLYHLRCDNISFCSTTFHNSCTSSKELLKINNLSAKQII